DIELHRPYIDEVTIKCKDCGGTMHRTPEVIDCWYDSGSMPFAQWHYPFENREIFEANFPANFISEAIDQTRGWFYTLMAISTLLFDCSPFQNCVVMGHVQDAEGKKMSKHLGNVVNPWDVLDKQGADAVRWYFYANGAPWLPTRFSGELVSEMQSKFMGTLWNTYAFFCMYASIDGYVPAEHKAEPADLTLMDKWVLSRLNSLVKAVDEGLAGYKITESARAIQAFVDELSNWYVRLSKSRFWGKEWTGDKKAAYETLYTVLMTLCKLAAPFIPFMTETMYRNLASVAEGAPESVHLCDYPVCDESKIDRQLEAEMNEVAQAVTLGRACRNTANIKVRQALSTLYVKGSKLSDACAALIRDELNVENVEFIDDARAFTTYQIKPQLLRLGRRYGKLVPAIREYLKTVDGNAFMDTLEKDGAVKFDLQGTEVSLEQDDCLIALASKLGFVAETDRDMTVVIDTNLTPELIEKGFVREVISKLQTMRKEAGFDVVDRITVTYKASEALAPVIAKNADAIAAAVLATAITEGDAPEGAYQKDWKFNGEAATLGVRKNG
ncbi:MAG: class I tRNA ligase family protein, partial [Clostridia bacterium]|nr:class I tRNA ligase family protein [Clostridia bacterium]